MTTQIYDIRDARFAREAADPYCLEPAAISGLLADLPWASLAVIGDSVAAGAREPVAGYRDASFAERIGHALAATRPGFGYLNLGRRDALVRDVRDEQLHDALAFEPDLALVVAGGNDALRADFDPARTRDELAELLGPLLAAGAQPVTIGLFDLARSGLLAAPRATSLAARFDVLDAVTRAVAADHHAIHVDTHRHPLAADPGIFGSDRVHANARGHAVAAAAIAESLAAAGALAA